MEPVFRALDRSFTEKVNASEILSSTFSPSQGATTSECVSSSASRQWRLWEGSYFDKFGILVLEKQNLFFHLLDFSLRSHLLQLQLLPRPLLLIQLLF